MSNIIEAKAREGKTKGSVNKMRRMGNVPAIVYTKGGEGEKLEVDGKSLSAFFRGLKSGYLPTTVITLKRTDTGNEAKVIVKGIQYDKIKDDILHLDFLPIGEREEVNVIVPVRYTGVDNCAGIAEGGVLTSVMRHVPVRAKADNIPKVATGDVSKLRLKQSIRVKDLKGLEDVVEVRTNPRLPTAKITKR